LNGFNDLIGSAIHHLSQLAVPADASDPQAWNEDIEIHDSELLWLLLRAWQERRTCHTRPRSYRVECSNFQYMLQCATDASTSAEMAAAVVFDHAGRFVWNVPAFFNEMTDTPHGGYAIAHRELQGILVGVLACKAYAAKQGRPLDLITLACDNLNAIAWASSWRHYGPVVPEILQLLHDALESGGTRTRLYLVYIGTDSNLADPYSRNETGAPDSNADRAARYRATQAVLRRAQSCALGVWRVSGGVVGRVRGRDEV
jgi:hypothetical protein